MLPNEIRAPLINHQGRCSQMKSVSHCLKASLPLRSRGSTHRSKERPLGRPDSESVRMGNLLRARALILVLLCASKGCFWVLEQPMSSVMEWHPLFQRMLKLLVVRKLLIKMANYGGPTEKKTWLYSSLSKLMVYFPNLFGFQIFQIFLGQGSKSSKSFWVWVRFQKSCVYHTLTSYVFSGLDQAPLLHISRVFICPLNHRKKWLVTII